ncbi:MAG TPA: CRISPR-associated endonuclease Cas1 [Terriglobia bacterium]|nr:CRISPR-associated endonuclease Cas1 [Terriglobia bacterium]
MSTLYLDRKGLELRVDGAALALYELGRRCRTIPLALLDRVVIRSEVSLSSTVLGALGNAGCAAVILSGRQSRLLAIVHGRAHNDGLLRLTQYARVQDTAWRLRWAKRFVQGKVLRQERVLSRALAARPDCSKPIFDALQSLRSLRARLTDDLLSIESLRGMEGAAQAAYFRAFAALFPESLGFNGRNRRPPRDPVNGSLSLAYTLLHFEAVRTAYAAGLDPFLGFFHEIAFGRESLACDLIEPIRPLADRWVWEMFRSRVLRSEHFHWDKGACLLGKAGRARFYEQFEEFLRAAARRLRGYCRLLVGNLRASAAELPAADGEEDL